MEIFEGMKGPRIFKRRKDAELVAERNRQLEGREMKVQKVRVRNRESAQKVGMSVHPDLSIAARIPEENEIGYIVGEEREKIHKEWKEAIELLGK